MNRNLISICLILIMSAPVAQAEHCTREQAFDKHTLLTMESSRSSNLQLRIDMASLGKVLASGNYDLTCDEYNRVAAKYGIDFNQARKNLKAQKDQLSATTKITKKCNSTESANYFQKIQKKIRDSKDSDAEEQLNQWYYAHSQEMIVNPDVFCSGLKQFADMNGL